MRAKLAMKGAWGDWDKGCKGRVGSAVALLCAKAMHILSFACMGYPFTILCPELKPSI